MSVAQRIILALGGLVLGSAAAVALGLMAARPLGFGAALALAGVAIAGLLAITYRIVASRLVKPMMALAADLRLRGQTRIDHPPVMAKPAWLGKPWLGDLPDGVARLLDRLQAARNETDAAVAQATQRVEEQKSRLEAILFDLAEGVIVCNLEHRVLLYNHSARRILGGGGALGLDRPLFALFAPEPVMHALAVLLAEQGAPRALSEHLRVETGLAHRFVGRLVNRAALLQAKLNLMRERGRVTGYVLTFSDGTKEVEGWAQRDRLLRDVTVGWRQPLASLSAAAEILADQRGSWQEPLAPLMDIVCAETKAIDRRFAELTRRYDRLAGSAWPLADLYSADLFRLVAQRLAEADGIALAQVGMPVWIKADSHGLQVALEQLVRAAARHSGARSFEIGMVPGKTHAYIELGWAGEPVASSVIEAWLAAPLSGVVGAPTLREFLDQHASELWGQMRADGHACLRLPLHSAEHLQPVVPARLEAVRAEHYDFDLLKNPSPTIAQAPLRKLAYVAFDIRPANPLPQQESDDLTAIGAVRVVNGRILTGETFEALLDPGGGRRAAGLVGRSGIAAAAYRDPPAPRIVLDAFRAFAGDAVLVVHNAAGAMAHLARAAASAEAPAAENPVLDVLLLANHLQDETIADVSLTAIAARLGVAIGSRHTALGVAMITAGIFVKLLDLLETRSITTFGQVLRISQSVRERRRQDA